MSRCDARASEPTDSTLRHRRDHGQVTQCSAGLEGAPVLPPPKPDRASAVLMTWPGAPHEQAFPTVLRSFPEGRPAAPLGEVKYGRTRLFILTLGFSRKVRRLLTFRSSSHLWAELHERAFGRPGGAVRVVVLDNLRKGVLRTDVQGYRFW